MKYVKDIGITIKNISIVALIIYLLLLLYLTLFSPYFGRVSYHRSANLLPFVTMDRYLFSSAIGIAIINLAGNIFAFVPFGILLPMVFKGRMHFYLLVCGTIAASVAIEISQYLLRVGVADIDDVILNLTGGILGYCIYNIIRKVINIRK